MGEQETIENRKNGPNTVISLAEELLSAGLRPGMTILLHSSLSALGWVCGGAPAVIMAFQQVLTEEGTLVMPTHSGDLSDPAQWEHPPVPREWWETIRSTMPAYRKDRTPTRGMGIIPETFRKMDGVLRSSHPQMSFAAWGKHKAYILQDEHYDFGMNDQSPLGRLYELDGQVFLLGVGHDRNTSIHLAEYRAEWPSKLMIKNGMPIEEGGITSWREFDDIAYGGEDFEALGKAFEEQHHIKPFKVGNASCRMFSQRALVDFAVHWISTHRT
ncbi:aminoglycoside N(3)-acetyltransferase [Gracilinema caldarium]|uniref:Aminoglycoside N(3)-acetyltransferase n=1 Tax=Gracilinema caldarium (strain ATCC 51460 / DSM 7334 / H1) TaxID=744872 RepID=F8F348_GRAC1|nr:AAC(3) family N-acetyltransferase [Gracilinema caldarium]AEJ20374.1 Aminoglycoside N(3')-acetyltransferase [Gracilinema caldarium DSM 7334]